MNDAPEDMVLVPAGPFLMGNSNDYFDNDKDEWPQHVVDLPAFYIDAYPVTNTQYKEFLGAVGHAAPKHWEETGTFPTDTENHPVVGVTFFDAAAFAQWKGRRLLTEQEFEKAARGDKALRWPWGNDFIEQNANVGARKTSPVDAHPGGASPYGVHDISGNVWEWTSTWYALYPGATENKTVERLTGEKFKSVRGGAFASDIGSARGADRGTKKPDDCGLTLGFRTAQDVPGYEHYAAALEARNTARCALQAAAPDITDYTEHARARETLAQARDLLAKADSAFLPQQFAQSLDLARQARAAAEKAQLAALDYTKKVLAEKKAETENILNGLKAALNALPDALSPGQQALKEQALKNLALSQQFYDEGSWGYAQMHGIIGTRIVEKAVRTAGGNASS